MLLDVVRILHDKLPLHVDVAGKLIKNETNIMEHSIDEPMNQKVLQLLKTYPFNKLVKYHGFLSDEEKWLKLAQSDVFILASNPEAFPFSVIEAMLSKTPVIATPVGGFVDHFSNKESIIFFERGNPEALADSIKWISNNKEQTQRITSKAYDYVSENFYIQQYVESLLTIYSEINVKK